MSQSEAFNEEYVVKEMWSHGRKVSIHNIEDVYFTLNRAKLLGAG